MKKLRASVVGVGYLGTFHAQKYKNNNNVQLVGVFDVNHEQAKKVAQSLDVIAWSQLTEMIGKVDLATVSCSTQAHYEVAEFLLKNKIHVNIEKPITDNTLKAQKLIELASTNNVKLSVGHIERFNPAFQKWRRMMGVPQYLEFERVGPYKARGADVSVVHDLMIHDLDLLLSLKPGKILNISAQGGRVFSKTWDWAMSWITFESGLKVHLKSSRVSPTASRVLRALDDKNHWIVNLGQGEVDRFSFELGPDKPISAEKIATEKVDGLQKETDVFIDCILKDISPLITGEDGVAALELVERVCAELNHV